MRDNINAEVEVLDRVLRLLEERSVSHLVRQDGSFADFIEQIYDEVDGRARHLQQVRFGEAA